MATDNPFQIPNEYSYLEFLSDNELETLNKLSNVSNNLRTKDIKEKKLENMTLSEVYQNWSKTHIDILKDLSKFTGSKYKDYFVDIDQTEKWWKGIVLMFKDLFTVFTKDQRIIYVGMSIIFISIALFFISSSR